MTLLIILLLTSLLVLMLNMSDTIPPVGLIVLGFLWLIYLLFSNRVRIITPLTMPVLALLSVLPMSLFITTDLDLSLPKVYGILLSVSILLWIIHALYVLKRIRLAIVGLLFLAVGVATLGILSTEWTGPKLAFFSPIYNRLAEVIQILSISRFSNRINANSMGGALTFFLPLLLALLWDGGAFGKAGSHGKRLPRTIRLLYKITLIVIFLLVGVILFQTQARGAFIGTAAGLLAVAVWKDRRFLWLIPLGILVLITLVFTYANGDIAALINSLDTSEQNSFSTRLFAWQNALYVLQDFPITGTGIATYSKIFMEFYTLVPPEMQTTSLFHPHNTLLSVAIDLGIPALVLYSAMLGSFAAMSWQLSKSRRLLLRTTSIGLACGMLAHQVFGLMDAYVLGRNLGELQWIFFGCTTALYLSRLNDHAAHKQEPIVTSPASQQAARRKPWLNRLTYLLTGVICWVMFSLLAVSFIYINPVLSIIFAIVGGVICGIFLVHRFGLLYLNGTIQPLQPCSQPAV